MATHNVHISSSASASMSTSERHERTITDNKKPILCVDFDGVIHSYKSGWQGAGVIPDLPVPGALHWLYDCTRYFNVMIYSSRSKEPAGITAMKDWLTHHAHASNELIAPQVDKLLREVQFAYEKPAAFLTIDDRAIQFYGDWKVLEPKKLLEFKPWYQQV